jgi:putative salt-induced outer membrane protein YdiY
VTGDFEDENEDERLTTGLNHTCACQGGFPVLKSRPLRIMKNSSTPRSSVLLGFIALAALALGFTARADTETNLAKLPWEKSAALGLTLTKGNSDTLLFTGNILASQKREGHEIDLGADATYGENNHTKNNETLHAFGQFNHLFTPRVYVYGRLDGLHDGIAGVKYRLTVSPGGGYYWIKEKQTTFSTEAGPSMIYEKRVGHDNAIPPNTVYTTSAYFTLRLADKFEYKLNDHARIWQSAEILPQIDDFAHFIINAEIGVETGLTKKTSLRIYADDTYDSKPPDGRKKNDLKLVSALAWKF